MICYRHGLNNCNLCEVVQIKVFIKPQRDGNNPVHGTKSRYATGCRCEDCRLAKKFENKKYRKGYNEQRTRKRNSSRTAPDYTWS